MRSISVIPAVKRKANNVAVQLEEKLRVAAYCRVSTDNIDATNGPLMLADKILTIKPFDAKGTHKYMDGTTQADTSGYRTSYGSNLWETSNMRSWLNSTAIVGNVTWPDGCPPTANIYSGYNAYATEKGFMADGNFTVSERNVIK